MKTLFLPYRLAVKMKEIGFDEECLAYYKIENNEFSFYENGRWDIININLKNSEIKNCTAPLYQQAFDWFRSKGYQISIWVDPEQEDSCMTEIFFDKQYLFESREYRPYKETRQECLEKLIEIFGKLKNNS